MSSDKIKVLILEDNPEDAELNIYQLKKTNLEFETETVDNKEDFSKALKSFSPNIILSDYNLPQFNGLEALKLVKLLCPDTPVIMVSGVVGEELAVNLIKEGAADFVLKENLTRLPRAVTRTLAEAEQIKEFDIAKEKLVTLSKAIHQTPVSVIITNIDGIITYVNPKFEEVTGYLANEAIGRNPNMLKSGKMDKSTYIDLWHKMSIGETWHGELHNRKKDGTLFWEKASISRIENEEHKLIGFIALKEDITWLKKVQQDLIDSEERYRNLITLAPDPILELDLDGNIISTNPSFNELVNIDGKKKEKIPIRDQTYITEKSTELFRNNFIKAKRNIAIEPFEVELINEHRSFISIEVNLKLIRHQENKSIVLAICRDISERKKANELLLDAIMATEDSERQRISSEIHDGLQQTLICASLEFQQLMADDKMLKNKVLTQGIEFLNTAINESRGIAHTLLPKNVEDNGLKSALVEMMSRLELLSKVKFELEYNFDEKLIDKTMSLRLFNIAQEAINNALKHASPSIIKVIAKTVNNKLILNIYDDGIGFDPESIDLKNSYGIISMEHKANAISSKFTIESSPDHGCNIWVEVPLF